MKIQDFLDPEFFVIFVISFEVEIMIKFNKIREVKDPKRNVGEDAGFDFFVPEYNADFEKDFSLKNDKNFAHLSKDGIMIAPRKDVMIPSGIQSSFDKDVALIAMNKSGISSKQKLIIGACVVDSSYQGEIHLHLFNMSDKTVNIPYGQKLVQFVPYKIDVSEYFVSTGETEFFTEKSKRGDEGFGSTGI